MHKMSTDELIGHPFVHLVVEHLDPEDPDIPGPAVQWLLGHRSEALPLLLSLIADPALLPWDAPARGFLPGIAADLLGVLDDPSAVEPLLHILADLENVRPDIDQWDCIWDALHGLEEHVTEPALRFYERASTARARTLAAMILGDVQSDDPRVLEVLVAELPNEPSLMSTYLARFGDRRALPFLLQAFDDIEPLHSGGLGDTHIGQPLLDLHDAIAELDGAFAPTQTEKYERAWQVRYQAPPPPHRPWDGRDAPTVPITAVTLSEFCRQALLVYATLNMASYKIGMRPAHLWHYACTRWQVK